ncbi:MAG TPA: hypothetical protein PKI05_14310 [Thermogutta sp.]|nr:hypothetical protein [Thermogutta sp.]HOP75889.1 hypothetical protein [Thermogutta sp.]
MHRTIPPVSGYWRLTSCQGIDSRSQGAARLPWAAITLRAINLEQFSTKTPVGLRLSRKGDSYE